MRRLIWGFVGRTNHTVRNRMTRLNFNIVFTIEGPHQQQQQNHCLRTDDSLSHLVVGVNVFYWRKIFSLDYIVVKTHNLSSSHRGFLINYKLKQVLPLPPRDFADLLCFCSVLYLLYFVHVCLYVLCGHLLGKGWPLGSRLWCLLWVCHFPIGILGQVWYLIVSIPDLCTITYFYILSKRKFQDASFKRCFALCSGALVSNSLLYMLL